jgi:hypothetical protein
MAMIALPRIELDQPWTSTVESWSATTGVLRISDASGPAIRVEIERCAVGRLQRTYPVSFHDIELRLADAVDAGTARAVLDVLVPAILRVDPDCRRVVFSGPQDDTEAAQAADAAGFRFVVDVDLPDTELRLFVVEPHWVTAVDIDLHRVPGA